MISGALSAFADRWAALTPDDAMAKAAEHTTTEFAAFAPIDPAALAARFGATVVLADVARVGGQLRDHGELTVREGKWLIRVPRTLSKVRRRFSVAHEIAHILLFSSVSHQPALVRELRSASLFTTVERLCDTGAAQLLMPTHTFLTALEPLMPVTGRSVEQLAARFNVSLEAAARRIVEVRPDWEVMFWELATDHPRGAAWRTAKQVQREGRAFLPPGMSSSRLDPDVVSRATRLGETSVPVVDASLPGVTKMTNVSAWHVPRGRHELIDVPSAPASRQTERVFVFYQRDA